ncbi:MAG: PilZ domain-containing protein [Phycisphaerales bacterium]
MEAMTLERPSIQSVIRWARSGFRERRLSRRHAVNGLWCDKGQILDLSGMGLRLQSPRRWQEGRTCSLSMGDGDTSVTIEARCVWCRQDGLFSHQIGLVFEDIDPAASEHIARLVMMHETANETPVPPPARDRVDPADSE